MSGIAEYVQRTFEVPILIETVVPIHGHCCQQGRVWSVKFRGIKVLKKAQAGNAIHN